MSAPLCAVAAVALPVYGLISGVGGALSALPLPFLPCAPEQTAWRFLIHIVHAARHAPLIVVARVAMTRATGKSPGGVSGPAPARAR